MTLGDDEFKNVLVRASEIELSEEIRQADVELLMAAAEEAGIPRSAVERALRERLLLPMKPPTVGQLTFVRSADDKYYVAEVLRASSEGFMVRFLKGSEHTVQLDDLRPCSFLPGERVVVNWPWWGPWTCTVLSYDMDARRVTVSDGWGEIREFPIGEVWLAPRKAHGSRRARLGAALAAAALAGAAIGSIVTSLFAR